MTDFEIAYLAIAERQTLVLFWTCVFAGITCLVSLIFPLFKLIAMMDNSKTEEPFLLTHRITDVAPDDLEKQEYSLHQSLELENVPDVSKLPMSASLFPTDQLDKDGP